MPIDVNRTPPADAGMERATQDEIEVKLVEGLQTVELELVPADWRDIYFVGPAASGSRLDHVVVRYGGASEGANIYVANSSPTMPRCVCSNFFVSSRLTLTRRSAPHASERSLSVRSKRCGLSNRITVSSTRSTTN